MSKTKKKGAASKKAKIRENQHKSNVQDWWDQVRKSKTLPEANGFLMTVLGFKQKKTRTILWDALNQASSGCIPGTISYLLDEYADDDFQPCNEADEKRMIEYLKKAFNRGPGEDKPSEQDLWALANRIPFSDASEQNSRYPRNDDSTFFEFCHDDSFSVAMKKIRMHKKYPVQLRDFIYSRARFHVLCDSSGTEQEQRLIEKSVMPKIKSCVLHAWGKRRLGKMDKEKLLSFFRILMTKSTNMTSLEFDCPLAIVEPDGATETDLEDLVEEVTKLASVGKSKIQQLAVKGSTSGSDCLHLSLPILRVALFMPCLLELHIGRETYHGETRPTSALSTPLAIAVKSILECQQIRKLRIYTNFEESKCTTEAVASLFDGFKKSSSLERLQILGNVHTVYPTYQNILLEAVTTSNLGEVLVGYEKETGYGYYSLGARRRQPWRLNRGASIDIEEAIQYHALLNRCGRAAALDPVTTLTAMVDLLGVDAKNCIDCESYTLEQLRMGDHNSRVITFDGKINAIYGLIRESPSMVAYFRSFLAVPVKDRTCRSLCIPNMKVLGKRKSRS